MCEGSSEVPEQKVELAGEDGVFHLALSSLTVLKKRRGHRGGRVFGLIE